MEAARNNLRFSLDSWPEEGLKTDFSLAPSILSPCLEAAISLDGELPEGEAPLLASPLKGRLEMHLYGRRLRIKGAFAVKIELTCHRCLASFVDQIGDQFEETVELVPQGGDMSEEQTAVEVADGHFDLTPVICEFFWLSWPMKILCRPDCAGLCLSCGANLNDGPCSCQETVIIRH